MANWSRYGDAWVNLDQAEALEVREVDDGNWRLMVHMPSGRTVDLLTSDDEALARRMAALLVEPTRPGNMLWLWGWVRAKKRRDGRNRRS